MSTEPQKTLLFVTGLSGAGMSSVLKTLEDLNFEVFDNFPLGIVRPLIADTEEDNFRIAIGIDTRTRGFSPGAVLKTAKILNAKLLFITCDKNTLQKRFTETRRRHPLAKDKPVHIGIKQEEKILANIRDKADITIDTTELSVHDLRHILEGHFAPDQQNRMTVALTSFGFRNGLPREADIVMDVRFVKNPHWVKALKPQSGLDPDVGAFIEQDSDFGLFMHNFTDLMQILLPRYQKEGKSYLTIAIGCTGGRHRSVYTVEKLGKWLEAEGYNAYIEHRDLPV